MLISSPLAIVLSAVCVLAGTVLTLIVRRSADKAAQRNNWYDQLQEDLRLEREARQTETATLRAELKVLRGGLLVRADYIEQLRHWGMWAKDDVPREPPPYPEALTTLPGVPGLV